MQGFDVNRFLKERSSVWSELESMLLETERGGMSSLGLERTRKLGSLYRAVSSDLVRARTELVDAAVVDYLNDLVARAYAQIYSGTDARARKMIDFFAREFPALVRKEGRMIGLSAALLVAGTAFGAITTALDPTALGIMIPEDHQAMTPAERVAEEESGSRNASGDTQAAFSSFLFTHNITVTFLVFALGVTYGFGTLGVLFANGVPLGALAMQYHQYGKDLFFYAWILPHGIPELTQITIAGAAGLIIARGMWIPARRTRREALVAEAKTAARLIVGGMPLLVVAGLIEGTISQIHEPRLPYVVKLAFAFVVAVVLGGYLLLAGRGNTSEKPADEASDVESEHAQSASARTQRMARSSANR